MHPTCENLPVSFCFTDDPVMLLPSSSLDDMSLGILRFTNNHKLLKLQVFYTKTHGNSGRTCVDATWPLNYSYFTSVAVSDVVLKQATVRRFALTKPGQETQTPRMHLERLRNASASVGKQLTAADKSRPKWVNKTNIWKKEQRKPNTLLYFYIRGMFNIVIKRLEFR